MIFIKVRKYLNKSNYKGNGLDKDHASEKEGFV